VGEWHRHASHPALTAAPAVRAHARTDQKETAPMTTCPPQGLHWFAQLTRAQEALGASNRAVA
jgi:crotonobetainyl-CoA:carnitine CoA-transferase CaiB-like acyl-CoA transferase